jgi:hypothetical protein
MSWAGRESATLFWANPDAKNPVSQEVKDHIQNFIIIHKKRGAGAQTPMRRNDIPTNKTIRKARNKAL